MTASKLTKTATRRNTGFFNASDWSGEEIDVAYTVRADGWIDFEMYGYTFEISTLATIDAVGGNNGCRILHGSDWSESLTTLFFFDHDGNDELAVVKAAARYVRNHV